MPSTKYVGICMGYNGVWFDFTRDCNIQWEDEEYHKVHQLSVRGGESVQIQQLLQTKIDLYN